MPTAPTAATAPPPISPAPIAPPTQVRAERADGAVRISWEPSATVGTSYRVTRIDPGGRRQVVGRTSSTALDDGGADSVAPIPAYEVTATLDGAHSTPATSNMPTPPPSSPPAAAHPTPTTTPTSVDVAPVTDVTVTGGLVRFRWPAGVTEVMVVIRTDAPPSDPHDPSATSQKLTNMRYEIDGGFLIPGSVARPAFIAVASCRRDGAGRLQVAADFGPSARVRI